MYTMGDSGEIPHEQNAAWSTKPSQPRANPPFARLVNPIDVMGDLRAGARALPEPTLAIHSLVDFYGKKWALNARRRLWSSHAPFQLEK